MSVNDVVGVTVSVEVEVNVVGEAGGSYHFKQDIYIGNFSEHLETEAGKGDIQVVGVGCRILARTPENVSIPVLKWKSTAAE